MPKMKNRKEIKTPPSKIEASANQGATYQARSELVTERMRMVLLIRLLHGAITVFFLSCIAYVYYCGITNCPTIWSYLAAVAILIEGLVVYLNQGNCPLGKVHHKYGDEKTFFELIFPKYFAKRAVPFFAVVATVGIIWLFWRGIAKQFVNNERNKHDKH